MELSLESLARRLKEREEQIDLAVQRTLLAAADSVRLAIEQGEDLLLAKAKVKHGQWEDWLANNFPKSDRRARDYMELAKKKKALGDEFFKDARTIEGAFRLLELLPAMEHEQAALPGISIPPIFQRLNFVAEWVTKEAHVIKSWTPQQREELKQRLRPVLELWKRLEASE